jgi:ureidoacrylate peracid hydrolase
MQADFASPNGALALAGADVSPAQPALGAAKRLAAAARLSRTPVIFVGLATTPGTDSPVWSEWRRRSGAPDDSALCRAGTPGASFVGPTPQPGEAVIHKLRYSGFFGTSLDAALRARGVDTVLICGLTTECCVDCTVRDACHLDYFVYVAADACAAYDRDLHEATLKSLALNCATVLTTDDIVSAWSTAETTRKEMS